MRNYIWLHGIWSMLQSVIRMWRLRVLNKSKNHVQGIKNLLFSFQHVSLCSVNIYKKHERKQDHLVFIVF